MSNTTYTGRVYDSYGEIIDEMEGHSVEAVELTFWTSGQAALKQKPTLF